MTNRHVRFFNRAAMSRGYSFISITRAVFAWVTLLSAVGSLVLWRAARIGRTEWRALLWGALDSAADIRGFFQTIVHAKDVSLPVVRSCAGLSHGAASAE